MPQYTPIQLTNLITNEYYYPSNIIDVSDEYCLFIIDLIYNDSPLQLFNISRDDVILHEQFMSVMHKIRNKELNVYYNHLYDNFELGINDNMFSINDLLNTSAFLRKKDELNLNDDVIDKIKQLSQVGYDYYIMCVTT